ncbi:hypothetical protein SFC65_15100 [Priestia filamentosa]|uniref:hypothetical protein n=1 Tax=Priestia filamentosa TaxID=1402861 RepID=UPI0039826C4D
MIIIILLASCCAYYIYWSGYKKTTFLESSSPNQINSVKLVQIGNSLYASPEKIEIYFENKYYHTERVETVDIANHLASNVKEMYEITWKNDEQIQIKMNYERITKTLDYDFKDQESKMNFDYHY